MLLLSLNVKGVYLVLFIQSIQVLLKWKQKQYRLHIITISILFSLATLSFGLNVTADILALKALNSNQDHFYLGHLHIPISWNASFFFVIIGDTLKLAGNIVTDIILIWRCHCLWQGNKRIIVPISLLCFANNGIVNLWGGLWVQIIQSGYADIVNAWSNAFSSSLLTLLIGKDPRVDDQFFILEIETFTAIKIFNIGHQVIRSVESSNRVKRMYRTIFFASLESGLLYPILLVIYAGSATKLRSSQEDPGPQNRYTYELLNQPIWNASLPVMGIGSTLIIVRTAIGIAIDNEKSFRETVMRDLPEDEMRGKNEQTVFDIQARGSGDCTNLPQKNQ
ncbi:hypothetical protein L218DRAFT_1007086 [Marasmius fiardii PR-910]|nr:hypothetical protein L218DRAFT_1007086 [Marasmius fiardii PR-910]